MSQEPSFELRPKKDIPLFHKSTKETLEATRDQLESIKEAKRKPHVLDRSTFNRIQRVYKQMNEDTDYFLQQCTYWKSQDLNANESEKVSEIEAGTRELHVLSERILDLAKDFRGNTINDILEKTDEELALAVLSGEIKSPF